MDLYAKVKVNFLSVTVTLFCYIFFILISINNQALLKLHKKIQLNLLFHFGEMDLNAWVDVIFLGST